MKTEKQIQIERLEAYPPIEGFHAVEFFRAVKEQIANEIEGMSFEEKKKYFAEKIKEGKLQQSPQQ